MQANPNNRNAGQDQEITESIEGASKLSKAPNIREIFDESTFESIGRYGKQAYGPAGEKVYEELALSFASLHLHRQYGAKSDHIRMLRPILIFGESDTFKSQMVRDFADKFLPGHMEETRIDTSTVEVLEGSIAGEQVTPSPLSTADYARVEWDTLVGSRDANEIMDMFLKALDEGNISRHLLEADRADIADEDIPERVEISGSNLTSFVDSLIIGIVHLDSDFWEVGNTAFFNRQLPVYVDHPPDYKQIARSENKMTDDEIEVIREEFTDIFQTDLDGSFNSLPNSLYDGKADEILGVDSMRLLNMMNVTASCKALLEGKVSDGEIQWDKETLEWLEDRMRKGYSQDIEEYHTTIVGNKKNVSRELERKEKLLQVLEYVGANNPATQEQIAENLDIPRATVADYLNERLSGLVTKVGGEYQITTG